MAEVGSRNMYQYRIQTNIQDAYSYVYGTVTNNVLNTVFAHPLVAVPSCYDPSCSIHQCAPLVPVVSQGRWRPNLPFCFPNVDYNLNHLHLGPSSSPRSFCGRVFLLWSPETIVTLDCIYFCGRRIWCVPVLGLSSKKPYLTGWLATHCEVWLVSSCKWQSVPENSSMSRMLQRIRYVKMHAVLQFVVSRYASVLVQGYYGLAMMCSKSIGLDPNSCEDQWFCGNKPQIGVI
jgi:hypothetical protein